MTLLPAIVVIAVGFFGPLAIVNGPDFVEIQKQTNEVIYVLDVANKDEI